MDPAVPHRARQGCTMRPAGHWRIVFAVMTLIVLASATWSRSGAASAGATALIPPDPGTEHGSVRYRPPVDAPVTDPFRPPLTPYGPGNRGIEYATVPGTLVRAAADGLVVFAGPVAGALHVTVLHGDGIRTSYSFLAVIRVRRGPVWSAVATWSVSRRRGCMSVPAVETPTSTRRRCGVGPSGRLASTSSRWTGTSARHPVTSRPDRTPVDRCRNASPTRRPAQIGGAVSGVGRRSRVVAATAHGGEASRRPRSGAPWWNRHRRRYNRSLARHPPNRPSPPRPTHGRRLRLS